MQFTYMVQVEILQVKGNKLEGIFRDHDTRKTLAKMKR